MHRRDFLKRHSIAAPGGRQSGRCLIPGLRQPSRSSCRLRLSIASLCSVMLLSLHLDFTPSCTIQSVGPQWNLKCLLLQFIDGWV